MEYNFEKEERETIKKAIEILQKYNTILGDDRSRVSMDWASLKMVYELLDECEWLTDEKFPEVF